MDIFILEINNKKYKQYKTMKDALHIVNKLKIHSPNSKIAIFVESYEDYNSYTDTKSHYYLLYLYNNNKIEKFIDYM